MNQTLPHATQCTCNKEIIQATAKEIRLFFPPVDIKTLWMNVFINS